MNRALRAATMGVLLLSPAALTACGAGQVTQTATQDRDKTGGQAQVGDITLRQAALESPRGGSYDDGDDADLRLAIVNTGRAADTLTGIEGEGFAEAEIDADGEDELEIPAGRTVFVGSDGDAEITLTDLDEGLTTGQYLTLTLIFEEAGEVELRVTVATPDEAREREEAFDFHHEEGHSEEGVEDTARERESAEDN
ncbi:copper chaperone PCu(A)C [Blastococcus sp. PRF04-17]|uniref:copper chaperone PCu(A)C n=1 Tax=Blastococcus sp. PRF04-17 TaxID=2933797 RepID=UPI001FF3A9DF|nr:copper chaperone PCu(A)C [Blastococcus sp. PRF04-17]UOX99899.1 copper chaperone PCu(A)C [Blastococcus sp. PRF04-17]